MCDAQSQAVLKYCIVLFRKPVTLHLFFEFCVTSLEKIHLYIVNHRKLEATVKHNNNHHPLLTDQDQHNNSSQHPLVTDQDQHNNQHPPVIHKRQHSLKVGAPMPILNLCLYVCVYNKCRINCIWRLDNSVEDFWVLVCPIRCRLLGRPGHSSVEQTNCDYFHGWEKQALSQSWQWAHRFKQLLIKFESFDGIRTLELHDTSMMLYKHHWMLNVWMLSVTASRYILKAFLLPQPSWKKTNKQENKQANKQQHQKAC